MIPLVRERRADAQDQVPRLVRPSERTAAETCCGGGRGRAWTRRRFDGGPVLQNLAPHDPPGIGRAPPGAAAFRPHSAAGSRSKAAAGGDPGDPGGGGRSDRAGDAGRSDVAAPLDLQEHTALGRGAQAAGLCGEPRDGRPVAARARVFAAGNGEDARGDAASGPQRPV